MAPEPKAKEAYESLPVPKAAKKQRCRSVHISLPLLSFLLLLLSTLIASLVWFLPRRAPLSNYRHDDDDEYQFEDDDAAVVGMSNTIAGPSTTVESCYDPNQHAVSLAVSYSGIKNYMSGTMPPWLALSFRKDWVCRMTPSDGSPAEVMLILNNDDPNSNQDDPQPIAYHTLMGEQVKETVSGASMLGNKTLLETVSQYSNVTLTHEESSITLTFFKQLAPQPSLKQYPPDRLYLTYAYGQTEILGHHAEKGCFEVIEFPVCPN